MDLLGIGIGLPQLLLVLLVALLVLGPERLPEVARQLARGLRTLRSYADDVQGQFQGEIGGLREEFLDIQRDLSSIHGDLRGGLIEIDSTVRSIQAEVNSVAVTPGATGVLGGPSPTEGLSNITPPSSLDYVPAAPKPPTMGGSSGRPAEVLVPLPDGRLPDYRPGGR